MKKKILKKFIFLDKLIEQLPEDKKIDAKKLQGKYMTAHFRTEIRENAEHSKERLEYLKQEYRNEENPLNLTESLIDGKMNDADFIKKIDNSQERIMASLKSYERD